MASRMLREKNENKNGKAHHFTSDVDCLFCGFLMVIYVAVDKRTEGYLWLLIR